MQCGFCARPIHIIEDYIYHGGLTFHPQTAAVDNVYCSPRVRAFEEESVWRPKPGTALMLSTLKAAPVSDPS